MIGLAAWRDRRELKRSQVAGAVGISAELLERIEAGEVVPAPEVAVLLHVLTGGEVPIPAGMPELELQAVGARGVNGWGVVLLAGAAPLKWMSAAQARLLATALELAAESSEIGADMVL